MKKLLFFSGLAVLFLFCSCSCPKPEVVDADKEISEVKKVLDKYRYANENQDINVIEEIWCPNETIVSIGTEKGDRLVGFTQIQNVVQRQFETFSETYITPANQIVQIGEDGKTAWFSQTMNYNFILDGTAYSFKNLRYTGVLIKKEGKWKLVQTHMSIPYNPLKE
ncbi:MAG: nuclear transport factor 2 family protein [Bacteroidales bacterium]|nr:nuclear transport factor 2 family protein [Bacteroidales bacterium]